MNQGLRFSLQVGFAAALAVAICGVLLSWRVHQDECSAFSREAAALAHEISPHFSLSQDPIDPEIKNANQLELRKMLALCPYMREIALIDKYNKVEARAQRDDYDGPGTVGPWREDLTPQEVLASEEDFEFLDRWQGYYSVYSPDEIYWGKLRIMWDSARVQNKVNGLLFMTLIIAVSMGILGLLSGVLLYRTTLSARVAEMADNLRHIINSGFRGRVNSSGLPTELGDLGDQLNRVLDGLTQQQKRVVILEDSLRQTESSFYELQTRSAEETESTVREQEMALYAFQRLFENISDGAVLTDGKGRVLAMNAVAERWMHILGQESHNLSDDKVLRLIQRVTSQSGLDRDTCQWDAPNPLRGGRSSGRATAVVLRRENNGVIYILLLLRIEEMQSRNDWLAPLSEHFLFEELLPWLSRVLGERERLPEVPVIWELIDRHIDVLARLSALREIGAIAPEDFRSVRLGPWLAQHLQAADLFSRMISVRFHSSRADCVVWTVDTVLGQAIDLLIELLIELAEDKESNALIDLFADSPASGGLVLRFEVGFELAPGARGILRSLGNDDLDRLMPSKDAGQHSLPVSQQIKIVGVALLRALLGCRIDLREGEISRLCVRWTFPPGSDHGAGSRAPNSSDTGVRVNRLIRNYLTQFSGTIDSKKMNQKHRVEKARSASE